MLKEIDAAQAFNAKLIKAGKSFEDRKELVKVAFAK